MNGGETMEAITLLELNRMVKDHLRIAFTDTYWVRAEISECKEHYSGHCYLELVQKQERTDAVCAKARATVWAGAWKVLKPYFEEQTGTRLQSGQKILVEVSVEFHELYGYNLVVRNIDPSYTMGELSRRRQEVIRQLTAEGVIDLNRELPWPLLPQRLAVVSSPSAAGYGDFMDQLHRNEYGFVFYTALFQAVMQGEPSEGSIVEALHRILDSELEFDAVVIIRGGGATADLSCFDRYDLCCSCAQFPLPIVSGIGHERDSTVLDRVAHVSVKTPTAAAEYLISAVAREAFRLDSDAENLNAVVGRLLEKHKQILQAHSERLRLDVRGRIHAAEMQTERRLADLTVCYNSFLMQNKQRQEAVYVALQHHSRQYLDRQRYRVDVLEKTSVGFSPDVLIKRGFSLTLHRGKIVKSVSELPEGAEICTRLGDGELFSVVNKKVTQND